MSLDSDPLSSLAQETSEISAPPPAIRDRAPTMGNTKKLNYSHDAMIDMILANPGWTQDSLAAKMGYSPSWISNVMASDAFQSRLTQRREEVIDPVVKMCVDERIKGLVSRSLAVLQKKLEAPAVSDTVALKAFELGARALGLGGNAPPPPPVIDLDRLAGKLLALNGGGDPRTINEGE